MVPFIGMRRSQASHYVKNMKGTTGLTWEDGLMSVAVSRPARECILSKTHTYLSVSQTSYSQMFSSATYTLVSQATWQHA